MTRPHAELGDIQQTLFIPLAGRARETQRRHPVLRDPRAVEMVASIDFDAAVYGRGAGGGFTVARTSIFDYWVREFLSRHPAGTVVELGTGLNTRFERVDNGHAQWIDLDLPDTIALRREFFTDTSRRHMVEASVLDESWRPAVAQRPAPYLFVAEGVLVYLPPAEVEATLARIAREFPGAFIAIDTYSQQAVTAQHRQGGRRKMPARWAWACDDPRSLERLGLKVVESGTVTRPPRAVRRQWPPRWRYLAPLADPLVGRVARFTLFQADGQ